LGDGGHRRSVGEGLQLILIYEHPAQVDRQSDHTEHDKKSKAQHNQGEALLSLFPDYGATRSREPRIFAASLDMFPAIHNRKIRV
jgi:hypothetical protein